MKGQQHSNKHVVFCLRKNPGSDLVSFAHFKPRVKKAALKIPLGKFFWLSADLHLWGIKSCLSSESNFLRHGNFNQNLSFSIS